MNSVSSHRVAGLLVQPVRVANDVGLVDVLRPILWFYFFEGHRHGLFAVVQDRRDVFDDLLGESGLLLFGFSWPEFDDDMRHGFSLPRVRFTRYCSSVTCSI